jgi:toxin ParE1/3/4
VTPLIWSPTSQRDIARIADWLEESDGAVAPEIIARIRESSWRLREFPLSGPKIDETGARKLSVPGTHYWLIYRLRAGFVEISRVRHAHEDWSPR